MITENWVYVPVRIQDIVEIGIGSVKIDTNGRMDMVLPSGDYHGKQIQEAFRKGEVECVMLTVVKKRPVNPEPAGDDVEEG